MADDDLQVTPTETTEGAAGSADSPPAKKAAARKTAAKKTTAKKAAAKKTTSRSTAKKAAAEAPEPALELPLDAPVPPAAEADAPAEAPTATPAEGAPAPAKKTAAKRTTKKAATKRTTKKAAAAPAVETPAGETPAAETPAAETPAVETPVEAPVAGASDEVARPAAVPLFQAPEVTKAPARRTRKKAAPAPEPVVEPTVEEDEDEALLAAAAQEVAAGSPAEAAETAPGASDDAGSDAESEDDSDETDETDDTDSDTESDDPEGEGGGSGRRRRRRGGRRRRKSGGSDAGDNGDDDATAAAPSGADEAQDAGDEQDDDSDEQGEGTSSRRRRRRRRSGDNGETGGNGDGDPEKTTTRVRKPRSAEDEITSISGSTRLEAKKQRRREGRDAGRRRAPIVSEAEFLARRESVDRVMVIRQRDELTQIGVLEDKVLVEHYVARESQTSLIGNVYLGRVQNVLPSMEAAFVDIGKGRNAVLYAGEVNWSALGHREGQPRKIESVLSSGQSILVQVTKDPIGHKGARLTSQVSLAGRFLVYVPDGTTSGISRKLPDTERSRLKALLKEIVPDTAGVIVRTAAEGASEEELTRDVERLKARWEDIEKKSKGSAPQLLYGEPDLTLKVVRDLFTEDFTRLVIEGDDAWETVSSYVEHVAPDLQDRLERYEPQDGRDVFTAYRVEEQIAKALDRKVWLPSGGSLVIDRTEAMTVVDVNTGKFTGSGGNLEETVTKNNLEAAEEVVRQLRLRDIGGIIVVDFIDMVLESNRDLVLRRLVECLGRDRTRHQVAEVTSLGLVQMTRKRIGTGLVEAFSENCEHCQGRGVVIRETPVEPRRGDDEGKGGRSGRRRGGKGGADEQDRSRGANGGSNGGAKAPSPADVAAMARHDEAHDEHHDEHHGDQHGDAPEQAQPAAEQAPEQRVEQTGEQPARSGRSGRRGRRSGSASPEQASEPSEQASAPAAEPAVEPATEPATELVPEAPSEPAPPRVVTRTRRRSASRPAGQPASSATAEPVAISEPSTPEAPATAQSVEPIEPEAAPAPVVLPAGPTEPPPAPRVVTRTRGRSAARPAGPPAASAASIGTGTTEEPPAPAAGATGEPPAVDGTEAPEPAGEAPHVEHVPVKKKGTRKR